MKRTLGMAGGLLLLALVLAVVGLVLRALRWLLIVAAVVLVLGALTGFLARKNDRG